MSAYSSRAVVSAVAPLLSAASVLDVGCAGGMWLRAWREQGIKDICGVDGDYIDPDCLEISAAEFVARDLALNFDLGRRFDLVQSLEVAEHIEPAASAIFAANLARHANRFILFSAAPPGQGGANHVNEQNYDFWRGLFEGMGFAAVDAVRPAIRADRRIAYWYRYNAFLYVRQSEIQTVSRPLLDFIVGAGQPLRDISPLAFRLRKMAVMNLPVSLQNQIARMKWKFAPLLK